MNQFPPIVFLDVFLWKIISFYLSLSCRATDAEVDGIVARYLMHGKLIENKLRNHKAHTSLETFR